MAVEDITITGFSTHDVRYPTNESASGTDAMNTSCDYSSAYVILKTSGDVEGHGMTFTIGRGNDIVCSAIAHLSQNLVGKKVEDLFADMGKMWTFLVSDPQLRWLGPEKGVISIATGAVSNAVWDLYAKSRKKPLWQLVADFTPEEFVKSTCFRHVDNLYITDAITPEEALAMLKAKEAGKKERIASVIQTGYPAYTTSVGWLGYSDAKVEALTKAALAQGFNHFKLKVGANIEDDLRRGGIIRRIIDDPKNLPAGRVIDPKTIVGKNAGPAGCVLMVDSNQVFDVKGAIDYVTKLKPLNPYFIEEPTAPDDVSGHRQVREGLAPIGIKVATGEHAHNRILFKNFLQADAIDVVQIDSCRLAGVNEVLSVLLMAAKFGKPVMPHAGGIGLCEYVIHLSLIDYICVSGSHDLNVLEFVDHLHEHFEFPISINSDGRYNVPQDPNGGYSITMLPESIKNYTWPGADDGYWAAARKGDEAKAAWNKAHNVKKDIYTE